jgi:site-specific recombinase XerD
MLGKGRREWALPFGRQAARALDLYLRARAWWLAAEQAGKRPPQRSSPN